MNTLSEIEEYYKTREQQLLKKIHQQEAALTAAEKTLKPLIKSQKAQLDDTNQLHATQERAFKEELYRDSLTGAYNRRYCLLYTSLPSGFVIIVLILTLFIMSQTYIQNLVYHERLSQMEEVPHQMFRNLEDVIDTHWDEVDSCV